MSISNTCQLIVYPDSMGSNLEELRYILETHLRDVVGGVHILPFYPSSADRGFAPLTYFEAAPEFGTWETVRKIGSDFEITVDFMLNHLSRQSEYFQDFLKKKDDSEYADLFIRYKDFWPGGEPGPGDLEKIYTRKPRPPYIEAVFSDGSKEKIWCTFDHEQIDINLKSEKSRNLIQDFIRFLCSQGISMLRLDAFAYTTKKPGTSCFFLEPEVWENLQFIEQTVKPYGVELLPEVHENYRMQLKIAEHGYWVYDFALPMLVLQALYDGSSRNLRNWLAKCPGKQITTLDTHDGIGVVDVAGLMSGEDIDRTKDNLFNRGANVKKVYNTGKYNNLDIYQLNCTYYSALGDNDNDYLLARAIQFFSPGVPQVYYVGLFAGRNDIELLEKTKIGRNINRHNYTAAEIGEEVKRPVVRKLFALMKFRNTYGAFGGEFILHEGKENILGITWRGSGLETTLEADLLSKSFEIRYLDPNTGQFARLSLR